MVIIYNHAEECNMLAHCIYSGIAIIRISCVPVYDLNIARISDLVLRSEQPVKSYCFR